MQKNHNPTSKGRKLNCALFIYIVKFCSDHIFKAFKTLTFKFEVKKH